MRAVLSGLAGECCAEAEKRVLTEVVAWLRSAPEAGPLEASHYIARIADMIESGAWRKGGGT